MIREENARSMVKADNLDSVLVKENTVRRDTVESNIYRMTMIDRRQYLTKIVLDWNGAMASGGTKGSKEVASIAVFSHNETGKSRQRDL